LLCFAKLIDYFYGVRSPRISANLMLFLWLLFISTLLLFKEEVPAPGKWECLCLTGAVGGNKSCWRLLMVVSFLF